MKYNCCKHGILPTMSEFSSLEVKAVYPFEDPKLGQFCEALSGVASNRIQLEDFLDDEDPSKLFFTVYGCNEDGEAEALHDEPTLEKIMVVANDLSKRFSLEVIVI